MRLVYDHAARRAFMRDGRPIADKEIESAVLREGPRYVDGPGRFFRLMPPRKMAAVMDWMVLPPRHITMPSIIEVEIVNRRAPSLRIDMAALRREQARIMAGAHAHLFKPNAQIEAERAALIQAQQTKPAPVEPVQAEQKPRWCHADQYIEKLEKRGYRVLGKGAFSTVLARPGSAKVIKVGRNMDAWPDYVLWAAKAGFAGTWAPRLFSFRRHKGHMCEFYVAVIERLDAVVATLEDYKKPTQHPLVAVQSNLSSFLYAVQRTATAIFSDCYMAGAIEADKLKPGALRFALAMAQWRNSIGAGFDLHSNNWMVSGDRLVCTDPVVEPKGGKSTAPRRVTSRQLQIAA